MIKSEFIEWVNELQQKLPDFLYSMQMKKHPNKYKYSYSGDILGDKLHWGLGNNVFALRIWYHLYKKPTNFNDSIAYINTFQQKNGEFCDPFLKFTSFPMTAYDSLKRRDLSLFTYRGKVRRAETRQTTSLLRLYDLKPKYTYDFFPQTEEEVDKYLSKLDWEIPWGAGSHFSALVFFLSNSEIKSKDSLVDYAITWVNRLQKEDGCWYKGNPPLHIKINGAMKYFTALKAATQLAGYNGGKISIQRPEQLIDTALKATNDSNSCDNFNLTYTLRYASEIVDNSYRYKEIEKFFEQRLDIYKNFYFPKYGAFSFNKKKANMFYYGAFLTRGKEEPDIHGTAMFIWGLSVIANFWGLADILKLREHIP